MDVKRFNAPEVLGVLRDSLRRHGHVLRSRHTLHGKELLRRTQLREAFLLLESKQARDWIVISWTDRFAWKTSDMVGEG